jgi:formate dehydrogenase iron-sulfur subunit
MTELPVPSKVDTSIKRRGILVDITKCIGCGACYEACQESNKQPKHEPKHFDENSFTYLMDRGNDVYVRRLCMHCREPTCVSVCPVTALEKTKEGPVTYNPDKCMGCRYCMIACPFSVPAYEWHSVTPRVRKCEMCAHRQNGIGPACAEACPTGATITGELENLIADAKQRVTSDPKTYYQYVYGLQEVGGTSVLYIGPKRPAELGLPHVPMDQPMPLYTWNALKHVPDVLVFGGVLLGGLWWLTKRKEEVAAAERPES